MNTNIQALIKQAGIHQPERFDAIDGSNQLEKFAALIVKACADAADRASYARCKFPGDYVAEQMGFGEEEGVSDWRTSL